jgi:hypothetical protein
MWVSCSSFGIRFKIGYGLGLSLLVGTWTSVNAHQDLALLQDWFDVFPKRIAASTRSWGRSLDIAYPLHCRVVI